jgi:alpha-D-ribose 1-methylphosphonate 5-triphosphate synthase subunit PhnL
LRELLHGGARESALRFERGELQRSNVRAKVFDLLVLLLDEFPGSLRLPPPGP